MAATRFSRRDFVKLLARCGLAAGSGGLLMKGGGALGGGAGWGSLILPDEALATGTLEDLLATAPRARHWVSSQGFLAGAESRTDSGGPVPSDPGSCLHCHDAGDIDAAAAHEHLQRPVRCLLCAQSCLLSENQRGRCRARMNIGGELRSLVYGRPLSVHVDPIEKKPFYHFLPGADAFSLATAGCPLSCKFCQNWELSQARPEDYDVAYVSPERMAGAAAERGAPVIAFTYNEPTVFFEYLTDIARLAREEGLRCVLISCGFMQAAPLTELCELLDAIKIDLKGFSEDFYRKVCSAELAPVLRSIKQISRSGAHLELVNLVVPTLNDAEPMMKELCKWVMTELGPDVPLHFTRFHPDYKLRHLPPTPVATLERAREIALAAGIRYPFVGNVPGHAGNNSYCPGCGRAVIERSGFFIESNSIEAGRCHYCQESIAGVWS